VFALIAPHVPDVKKLQTDPRIAASVGELDEPLAASRCSGI